MLEKLFTSNYGNQTEQDRLIQPVEPGDLKTATDNLTRLLWRGSIWAVELAFDLAALAIGTIVLSATVVALFQPSGQAPTDWLMTAAVIGLIGLSLLYRWLRQPQSPRTRRSAKETIGFELYCAAFAGSVVLILGSLFLEFEPVIDEILDALKAIAHFMAAALLFQLFIVAALWTTIIGGAHLRARFIRRYFLKDGPNNPSATRDWSGPFSADTVVTSLIVILLVAPLAIWILILDQGRGSVDVTSFYFGLFRGAITPVLPYLAGVPLFYYLSVLFPSPRRSSRP